MISNFRPFVGLLSELGHFYGPLVTSQPVSFCKGSCDTGKLSLLSVEVVIKIVIKFVDTQ